MRDLILHFIAVHLASDVLTSHRIRRSIPTRRTRTSTSSPQRSRYDSPNSSAGMAGGDWPILDAAPGGRLCRKHLPERVPR